MSCNFRNNGDAQADCDEGSKRFKLAGFTDDFRFPVDCPASAEDEIGQFPPTIENHRLAAKAGKNSRMSLSQKMRRGHQNAETIEFYIGGHQTRGGSGELSEPNFTKALDDPLFHLSTGTFPQDEVDIRMGAAEMDDPVGQ